MRGRLERCVSERSNIALLKSLEHTFGASACGIRLLHARATKVMSTWQHASLVRLQPHYVYILGNIKGAVTTALHAHSMRKRLVRLKKDRFTPPLSPIRIALAQNKISLFSFIVFGLNFARARFVFGPLCSGVAFANNLSQPILPWGSHPP